MLKRKRSESEFSVSSGSTFSSPPRPGSSNFNFGGMDAGMNSPIRYGATASHLPSRTLKRFRDNRLPEEEIHRKLPMCWWCLFPVFLHRYAVAYYPSREHVEDAVLGTAAAPRPTPTPRANTTTDGITTANCISEISGAKISSRLLEHPNARNRS